MSKEIKVIEGSSSEFSGSPWFDKIIDKSRHALDEYKTAKTELVFAAKWEELKTRHLLGKLLVDNFDRVASADHLVKEVGGVLGISERLLQYCVKFYRVYPQIDKVPEGKNISWTRLVNTYLTEGGIDPKGCPHKASDIVSYRVCRRCGKRELIESNDTNSA